MTRSRKLMILGATVLALGATGMGIAQAVGDDTDEQATGPQADRAKRAAVEAVGAARAVAVERENEDDTAWEVEVVMNDGRQVEVDLDQDFARVGSESDDGGPNEDKDRDDD
jgi:uncharacterized membrane protein YkoI